MKQFVSLKLDDNENHQEPKQEAMPPSDAPIVDRIIAAIKTVYDPEIPVDIFSLGLIYSVRFHEDTKKAEVIMTLTSPHYLTLEFSCSEILQYLQSKD
jgi:hypothetical protein